MSKLKARHNVVTVYMKEEHHNKLKALAISQRVSQRCILEVALDIFFKKWEESKGEIQLVSESDIESEIFKILDL
jgi:hypothetical protein